MSRHKCVSFADCVVVYLLPDEHRNDTKGPWLNVAADRMRFLRRIQNTAHVINPIIQQEHREKIIKRMKK